MSTIIEGIAPKLAGDFGGLENWQYLPHIKSAAYDKPLELKPHEKLLIAVLLDAIAMLKTHPVKPRAAILARLRTRDWLLSDNDEHVFGFRFICEHFGWDHTWVRKKIIEHVRLERDRPEWKQMRWQVRADAVINHVKKKVRA